MSVKAGTLCRNLGKLKPSTTTFFLCDIQERFRPLVGKTSIITHHQALLNYLT